MEAFCLPISFNRPQSAFNYDVKVEVVAGQKRFSLNKDKSGPKEKEYCRALVNKAYELSQGFGHPGVVFAYDGLSIMYANLDFKDIEVEIAHEQLPKELEKAFRHSVSVRISATATMHELKLNGPIELRPIGEKGELCRFLSMVLTQDLINRGKYSVINPGRLFCTDESRVQAFDATMELRPGFSKSVRFVQNGHGIEPAFEFDYHMSAFFKSMPLHEALSEIGHSRLSDQVLHNVSISPVYNPHRVLRFLKFSEMTPTKSFFEKDGTKMSVFEYFDRILRIKIRPDLPLAEVKPREAGVFPTDKLWIVPHQKVPNDKISPLQTDKLLTQNAVLPQERHRLLSGLLSEMNLTKDNAILKAFGITVISKPYSFKNNPIVRPAIQLGTGVAVPEENASFRGMRAKYVMPAQVAKWGVFHDGSVAPPLVQNFVGRLVSHGGQKGMKIASPSFVQRIDMLHFWDEVKKYNAQIQSTQYLLFIDDKRAREPSHNKVKTFENKYRTFGFQLVTQQLNSFTVRNVVEKNQNATLENILNKMNLKNGGLNVAPKFEQEAAALSLDGGVFVVGYQSAHSKISNETVEIPDASGKKVRVVVRAPSIVGFAANYGSNANNFVGNYLFQNTEHESVDHNLLKEQAKHMLSLLKKNRPNQKPPATIVLLRDGIGEPQFDEFIGHELQAFKQACQEVFPDLRPKFICIVTTKDHNMRVFQRSGHHINNPTPGTIIDAGVVLRGREFIIIPHRALKGTAKPVKATVVANEADASPVAIQKFIHALAYSHQLTCAATALPEPIYQAEVLVARGLNVLGIVRKEFPGSVPRKDHQYDVNTMNNRFTVRNSRLECIRFTA